MKPAELDKYFATLRRLAEEYQRIHGPLKGVVFLWPGEHQPPIPAKLAEEDEGEPPPSRVRRHNETYTAVEWDEHSYTFTSLQAAVVKVLWEAWEQGEPPVHQAKILEDAGSDQNRLDNVFRSVSGLHPAWGQMIVATGRGHFQLHSEA